ncbi:hypothetical protein [Williamsia sp.]
MAYPPDPDEGQPGLVQLPDGRYAYRYPDSDDVIILKRGPQPNAPDI